MKFGDVSINYYYFSLKYLYYLIKKENYGQTYITASVPFQMIILTYYYVILVLYCNFLKVK